MCWLQVRQAGGTLVLRMEDVDEQRSKKEFADALMRDLQWLGLTWDEGPDRGGSSGPYTQQERYNLYDAALSALQRGGLLYPCYCSRARLQAIGAPHAGERSVYDGHCYGMTAAERAAMQKDPSWRVHVPPSVGLYAYQLAVSVDDGMMGITHVLRGRDLLSSTAQQIWLIEYLGYPAPQYTHVPMLIDGEGRRLSKRQQGITIESLRDGGADRDSVLSYLAYKGGLVSERARYPLEELARCCDLTALRQEDIVIDDDVMQAICAV